MNFRRLGKTGIKVSEISLGTWQVGGGWGASFDDAVADRIINDAIDHGVNFIDTADVYDDGKSEAAVGRVVRSRSERVFVATKCGRQISPHVSAGYTPEALRRYVEDSLRNSGLERLDLIQLHCPPTEVYYRPEIFGLFEDLEREGKIANLGVSVEKVEEALKAISYPNVRTVQIIYNMFRLRPAQAFFPAALKNDIGVIIRVPLASGLLSGKLRPDTKFAPGDHRAFNRDGEAFDKGETFSGVPYDLALAAVEKLRAVQSGTASMAQWALRWILDSPMVSTVIPGASRLEHVAANAAAADHDPLSRGELAAIEEIYGRDIAPHVEALW